MPPSQRGAVSGSGAVGRSLAISFRRNTFVRAFGPESRRRRYDGVEALRPILGTDCTQRGRRSLASEPASRRARALLRSLTPPFSFETEAIGRAPEQWAGPGDHRCRGAIFGLRWNRMFGVFTRPSTSRACLSEKRRRRRSASDVKPSGGIEARLRAGLRRELERTGQVPDEDPLIPRAPTAGVRGGVRNFQQPKSG